MKRNFIIGFILLVTLLTVNAVPNHLRKRVITFEPCPEDPPLQVPKVVPDPIVGGAKVTFFITGALPKTITTGSKIGTFFYDVSAGTANLIGNISDLLICTPDGVLECPYAAKTPIDISLYGFAPVGLPKAYAMLVLIEDINLNALGCARSFVGGAQPIPETPTAAATPPPAPPPTSAPPPPPPPPSSSPPTSPAPAAPSGGGKGAGGIQDFRALVS